jgi:hypothetical protein
VDCRPVVHRDDAFWEVAFFKISAEVLAAHVCRCGCTLINVSEYQCLCSYILVKKNEPTPRNRCSVGSSQS